MIDTRADISGLQAAQDLNARLIAGMQPDGAAGEVTRFVTAGLHRVAVVHTHVDTGALRGSHLMEVGRNRGAVFINPVARNPKSYRLVTDYAIHEHNRGEVHAFYDIAMQQADALADQAFALFYRF